MATTSASAVSAVLRRGGLLPVPRTRDGLHVTHSHGDRVMVAASVDSRRRERELISDAIEILTNQGYRVRTNEHNDAIIYVSGKEA